MINISKNQAKKLGIKLGSCVNKYNNKTSKLDNFKSDLERKRFMFLDLCKKNKLIKDFSYESERFLLSDKFEYDSIKYRSVTYTPDFLIITNNGEKLYEDTKGEETRKNPDYVIKKKIFIQKYVLNQDKISFKEVFVSNEKYF